MSQCNGDDIERSGLSAKTIEDGQTLDEQVAATARRLRDYDGIAATQLRIAIGALERIADEGRTSLRWRRATSGGAIEKPNVRQVADTALQQIDALSAALPGERA